MKEQHVTISITGGPDSGKTNIAALIAKALSEAGVDDLKVVGVDHDFAVRVMSFNPKMAQDSIRHTAVRIEDINAYARRDNGTVPYLMTYVVKPQYPAIVEPYNVEISTFSAPYTNPAS